MSAWSEAFKARCAAEADALTDEQLAELVDRFRFEIGSLYVLIGDHLEAHDPRVRP